MDKKGEEGDQEVPLRVQDSPGGRFFGQVGEHVCLHRISRYWISRWQGLYSRDGHLGVTLIKFASDQSGLMEAMRLAEYFEKDDHGWLGSISALERVFCYFCCP